MEFVLDFGSKVDMLTAAELREALAEDAWNRASLAGLKWAEQFYPTFSLGGTGTGVTLFTTPVNMVASGLVWSVMTLSMELSAAAAMRVYKGVPSAPFSNAVSNGRLVATFISANTQLQYFSKGQLILRGGDQLTALTTTAPTIQNFYIAAWEAPAERIGEFI